MLTEDIWHTVATAHNEALKRGVLNIWTVYDHPKDFPHTYVARRFEIAKGDTGVTDDIVHGELQILRQCFIHCGLTCMPRSDDEDDPVIVESWL